MTIVERVWSGWMRGHDQGLIGLAVALLVAGLVLSLAAGPAMSDTLRLDGPFSLSVRHAAFAGVAALLGVWCAQLEPRTVRRFALVLLVVAVVALILVALAGVEKKGARRWLELGAVSLQPSEFAKPALIIVAAWMLAERLRTPMFPGLAVTAGLAIGFVVLVGLQPDVGQTALTLACLLTLMALARVPLKWIGLGLGAIVAIGIAAYALFDHVRERIGLFVGQEAQANGQVGKALGAIANGGLFGQGLGEGQVKHTLPDAHADFIFAVAGEELGLLGACGLIGLYAAVTWIGLRRAARLVDPFMQLAATGLFLLFALQAAIHVGVNVALAPAKGMTLPLVSYGGSSLIASAITLGLACALVRARPGVFLHDRIAP